MKHFQRFHQSTPAFTAFIVALGITGCKEDVPGEDPCQWILDPGECTDDGGTDDSGDGDGDSTDGGDDDAGDGDGDGSDRDALEYCTTEDDGRERTAYQCNGSFTASISFTAVNKDCAETLGNPELCTETHEFGVGFDEYKEMPAVMACCDVDRPEDIALRYCAADLVEQICLSIPARIQGIIDGIKNDLIRGRARSLKLWLENHPRACYDALHQPIENVPGKLKSASWLVNGGENKAWRGLENFTIRIDMAEVTSTWLPEVQANQLKCYHNDYNNTEVFESSEPGPLGTGGIYRLADASDAAIKGPDFAESRVHGVARLASGAGCHEPWCSSLEIAEGTSGVWALEDLNLYADGVVVVHAGELPFEIDRAALRLYGTSLGAYGPGPDSNAAFYVIEPGDAQFWISGVSGEVPGIRWGSNTTPITLHKTRAGWSMDAFTVTHVGDKRELWEITVPETEWN